MTTTVEQESTEVARRGGSSLAFSSDQDFWTREQKAALVQIGVENASNADLAVFYHQCTRTGLDPFLRQIYMIERQGKQTIQTGIDGFRLVARRAADRTGESYEVEDTLWCGKDGQWSDVWLGDGPPRAAKAVVLRNGSRFSAVALFDEYVGKKANGDVNAMWKGKGAHMIGKCAEALAHRKAFPHDLSGIYTDDELSHEVIEHVPGEATGSAERVTAAEIIARRAPTQPKSAAPAPAEPVAEPDQPVEVMLELDQRKQLGQLFDRNDMDRANALAYTAATIGRPVKSSDELTSVEAHQLITALELMAAKAVVEDPPTVAGEKARPGQVTRLNALVSGFGVRERARRLSVISQLAGRTITTTSDLTGAEADAAADTLEGINGREQFDDMFSEPTQ